MPRPRDEQAGFLLLQYAMQAGEQHSAQTAAELVKHHERTCREYIGILYKARKIHVAAWARSNGVGRWIPVYAWGKRKDAVRPIGYATAEPKADTNAVEEDLPGGIWRVLFGKPIDPNRASCT